MTKLVRAVLLIGVLGLLAAGLPPALGQQTNDCTVEDDEALDLAEEPTPEGHFPHEEWAANAQSQAAFRGLARALEARFGSDTDAQPHAALSRGLIGSALDHEAHQMVVVVARGYSDTRGLTNQLERSASEAGKSRGFVRVLTGCHSADELMSAGDVIAGLDWHERADDVSFGFGLDAHTSTYEATFAESDADVANALKERLGDLVTIEYGTPEDRGRLDDGEPHYGGAGIRPGSENSNDCTSGFTVNLPGGGKGSVTAGHCFYLTGNGTLNGRNVYSGPEFYGESAGASNFPTYDMVRISPQGESFTNIIHVDPCCPSTRTVTGRGNPSLHEFLCVSGMVTRAVCGIEVTNTDYTFCTAAVGCRPNTFVAKKPGELVGQGGDSGAPSYVRPTTTTAHIRGMEIGGTSFDNFVGHKVIAIENHLSVTVRTSS